MVSKTKFFECKAGMDAAVVEFDPLSDSVGAAAEDHDLPAVSLSRFVFVAVGGVVVGGLGFELGGAGVDEPVGWSDAACSTLGSNFFP